MTNEIPVAPIKPEAMDAEIQKQAQQDPKESPGEGVPAKIKATSAKKEKKEVNMDVMMIKEAIINYIVPIICIVASILIGVLVLMPSYKSIPSLSADLDQRVMLEITLKNKLNNMNKLLDFKDVVEENSDLVNKVLVSEELVPGLLTQIDKIARESGLAVNRLNYGLGSSSSAAANSKTIEYSTVTVNLGATGSFAQLKNFMESIENAARLVIVDNFRYSISNKDAGTDLSVNFVLISPYLYVESSAVTDGPIDLDIADENFQTLINKIKGMRYYDPYEIDTSIAIIEAPEEGTEEGVPAETPAAETPAPEETPAGTPTEEIIQETINNEESVFAN